jgi:hypothetical protein
MPLKWALFHCSLPKSAKSAGVGGLRAYAVGIGNLAKRTNNVGDDSNRWASLSFDLASRAKAPCENLDPVRKAEEIRLRWFSFIL